MFVKSIKSKCNGMSRLYLKCHSRNPWSLFTLRDVHTCMFSFGPFHNIVISRAEISIHLLFMYKMISAYSLNMHLLSILGMANLLQTSTWTAIQNPFIYQKFPTAVKPQYWGFSLGKTTLSASFVLRNITQQHACYRLLTTGLYRSVEYLYILLGPGV